MAAPMTFSKLLEILWHLLSDDTAAAKNLCALIPASSTAPQHPLERYEAQIRQLKAELDEASLPRGMKKGELVDRVTYDTSNIRQSFSEYLAQSKTKFRDLGVQLSITLPLQQRANSNSQQFRRSVEWNMAVAPSLLVPDGGPEPSFRQPYLPQKMAHYLRDNSQRGIERSLLDPKHRKKVMPLRQQLYHRRLKWALRNRPMDVTLEIMHDISPNESDVTKLRATQSGITSFIERQVAQFTEKSFSEYQRDPRSSKTVVGRSIWEQKRLKYERRKRSLRRPASPNENAVAPTTPSAPRLNLVLRN